MGAKEYASTCGGNGVCWLVSGARYCFGGASHGTIFAKFDKLSKFGKPEKVAKFAKYSQGLRRESVKLVQYSQGVGCISPRGDPERSDAGVAYSSGKNSYVA